MFNILTENYLTPIGNIKWPEKSIFSSQHRISAFLPIPISISCIIIESLKIWAVG